MNSTLLNGDIKIVSKDHTYLYVYLNDVNFHNEFIAQVGPFRGKRYLTFEEKYNNKHTVEARKLTFNEIKNNADYIIGKYFPELHGYNIKFGDKHIGVVDKKAKPAKRTRPKSDMSGITEGDIFVGSWGYDQTNVNFYQITKVNRGTVKIRPIKSYSVEGSDGYMCCQVMPKKDSFAGPEILKRVSSQGTISMSCYSIHKWTGQSQYCSWYA